MKKDKESVDRTLKESIINKGYLEVRQGIDDVNARNLKDKLQRIILHGSTKETLTASEFSTAETMITEGVKHQSQVAMQVTQNPEMEDNDDRGIQMINILKPYVRLY
jgi:hypothetical protein